MTERDTMDVDDQPGDTTDPRPLQPPANNVSTASAPGAAEPAQIVKEPSMVVESTTIEVPEGGMEVETPAESAPVVAQETTIVEATATAPAAETLPQSSENSSIPQDSTSLPRETGTLPPSDASLTAPIAPANGMISALTDALFAPAASSLPDFPLIRSDTPTQNGRPNPMMSHAPHASSSRSSPAPRPSSPQRMVRTGFIYDPLMMLHCQDGYTPTAETVMDNGGGHPEEPMRIHRIFTRLAEQGIIKRMKKLEFNQVTFDQLRLVHTEDHWNRVQGTETLTDQYIRESKKYYDQVSLYVCRESAHCARLSCGGVIQACLSVCKGEVRNAFAIVRPPGHHAEPDEHMGFCFYNNVAVAAKEVMNLGLAKKVLILDWDVHHGNGTQRAFWNDPNVLYISIHRHDGGRFYPTSDFGALDMVGEGAGEGKSVNIPWPSAGFGDADYIYAFQKIVMPIAYEFAPDLVIISAGFDAADGDMIGGCSVTPAAYGHMTHMLCALARGKVVVALEGGYNLEAISRSSLAVAQVLLGETPTELPVLEASEVATEVIHQVAKEQSKYWKSIDVKACEPLEGNADNLVAPISIPDLLKIHRAYHMFEKHQLFQIPLASPELEESFAGQVICNEGVYEAGPKSTLVVFVHDFGNLRVETDGVSTTNVHMTNSYLLDTSDKIVDWVTAQGYGLIDINVLVQLPTQLQKPQKTMVTKSGPKEAGKLMRYIWDNYVELSEAEHVVLIGHGTGCNSIIELINHRDVLRKVKAVIQVAGMHSLVRIDPENETRRTWFKQSNRVYVPSEHPVLADERARKRLGGQIFTSERAKVVDVLVDVLPQIKEFITSRLDPKLNGTHEITNGGPSAADHVNGTMGDGTTGTIGTNAEPVQGFQLNGTAPAPGPNGSTDTAPTAATPAPQPPVVA